MGPNHFIVNVEAAVAHHGRYLIVERSPNEVFMPGSLAFPGGKVEAADSGQDVLEHTARRETWEETGVVLSEVAYIESHTFLLNGIPTVDVVMLCRYAEGEPRVIDPTEAVSVFWEDKQVLLADPTLPAWTRRSLVLAERARERLGW